VFAPIRRTLLIALAAVPLASLQLHAQRPIPRPVPECGTRQCVAAPCPPPPCARNGRVERTGREVRVALEGRVLRYEVTERWTNHGHTIGEADYVLPLPRGAAFEDLALEIDGEMVTGEALGAGEARRIYEEIVRRQKDPALVEWMEMGVLRTRIFPIQPGETRTVVVRFRAVAEWEGDALRIDVPAPRGAGTLSSGTALQVRVPAGAEFGEPWSPTHRVEFATEARHRVATVAEATGTVTLLVPVRAGRGAAMTVLTHAPARGEGYALITLAPPERTGTPAPRDVTFVIDVSGSMSGTKIEQARAAGRQLLNSLSRNDRFRLIAFSSDVNDFREGWTAVTPADRRAAEAWLDDLRAVGGTNIEGALERALEVRGSATRLGLVLFLTDGAPTVGERRAERLAARAVELRGPRRVFTFGLGADVKVGLLEQLALDGAGTAHFVRPEEDVERVVGVVAQRITRPVATNIRVSASGVTLDAVQPAGTIDLFAGQELTILARYRGSHPRGQVMITGQTPEGPVTWTTTAHFPERRTTDAFVGRLWATQRVGWLSAERRQRGASSELDGEIKQLGERWGIPTELTSYLVLEPGMDQMLATMPRDVPAVGGVQRTSSAQGQGRGERGFVVAAAPPPAAQEFEAAKAAAAMRTSRSVAESAADFDTRVVRRTATRMFTLQDSVWTDTRTAAPNARRVTVRAYSPAYFALIERLPELREIFAVGDRLLVHGRAVTLEIADGGVDRLETAALAAITRDW
jgi:Ca-activated chloride channel homolog